MTFTRIQRSDRDAPRIVHEVIPEREVIAEMWGEHAPPDLEAMLVMAIGGRSEMVIAVPHGEDEAARWQAAAESMWSALSEEDDATHEPEG